MTPRRVISRLRPIQSIAVTVIWRRSTAMGPCSPSLRVALLKRVLGSATAPTTSTRVRSSSSRKARRKLWLMDSPLLPNEDDTPGVASTEKPAYGLRGGSGRQRRICADRGGNAYVRVATLYTPDSPTVTPARRGDVKTTQRAGCDPSCRTVDVDSLGVAQLLLFGVHADVAAQEDVLGLHLRRSPSALKLGWRYHFCVLACRFGTYGGTVTPRPSAPAVSTCTSVPTKISTASSGARCARHHHHQPVQRAVCVGRRRALRSLSHTSGRVRSVTRCAAGASAALVEGDKAAGVDDASAMWCAPR